MEEILKQILEKVDTLNVRMDGMEEKFDFFGDRMDAHDRSNKHEFKQLNKRLDGITDVVAKTMEDITDLF